MRVSGIICKDGKNRPEPFASGPGASYIQALPFM
jgi:hypothetical protein